MYKKDYCSPVLVIRNLWGVQRMVYPREPMASVGSSEASTSGLGEKSTGWGTIWSMAFVGTADDVCASMTSKGASSLLLLAVLVHRQCVFFSLTPSWFCLLEHFFHGFSLENVPMPFVIPIMIPLQESMIFLHHLSLPINVEC
jgi:hypothetical protein